MVFEPFGKQLITGFQSRPHRKKKVKLIKVLLFTLMAAGIYIVFTQFIKKDRVNDSTEMANPLTISASASPAAIEASSLKEVVDDALEGTRGTYGIVIKNLKTGQSFYSDENRVFETGSLYKLWIMAVVLQQIQNGQLKEDQVLSEDAAVLNQKFNMDPDLVEQTEGTVTFTVHDALNQMITVSHNYAALLLTEKIRLSTVATFLKENGFSESVVGTNGDFPTTTPADIALFFEKLYKGELANEQYTQEMINLLKSQKLNDGLPKYLPDKSKVASKTGEIDLFKHDAGIVFTSYGDYIIVIMSESNSPPGAQERIALVSKGVFEYFTSKQ